MIESIVILHYSIIEKKMDEIMLKRQAWTISFFRGKSTGCIIENNLKTI